MVLGSPDAPFSLISESAGQTQALGRTLASLLSAGDVLCLVGELGAGKTCFAQGVGRGLGIEQPITSPTFVRIHEYSGGEVRRPFYHVDLYRVTEGSEVLSWGLEEYLYGRGVCAIEWANRVQKLLPAYCLWIQFEHRESPEARWIGWWAEGGRGRGLLNRFREQVEG